MYRKGLDGEKEGRKEGRKEREWQMVDEGCKSDRQIGRQIYYFSELEGGRFVNKFRRWMD